MQPGIYMIAEVGQAHEGSLGLAHSYIDALAHTGVDAVKFQMHIAEAESSEHETFRTRFSYLDETRMEYWKRMEFSADEWQGLKKHCEEKNLEFIATPSSVTAAVLLHTMGVSKFKVGSGDTGNLLLLHIIAGFNKDIILSSGMSSTNELDRSVEFLKAKKSKFSLLQCTSSYPAMPGQWGLHIMGEFKNRYQVPVGFSDHSGNIHACLAAAGLGADILEFHVVFDKRMFGPDSKSSLNMEQTATLVQGVRDIETALNNPVDKADHSEFAAIKDIFEKSIAINKSVSRGHYLTVEDLECKKPKGRGISVDLYETIIGKQVNKNLDKWAFITENDLADA